MIQIMYKGCKITYYFSIIYGIYVEDQLIFWKLWFEEDPSQPCPISLPPKPPYKILYILYYTTHMNQ